LARVGAGAFEFFDPKTKSKWEGRIKAHLSKACQPSLSNIEVIWQQFNDKDAAKLVQAPANIMALFNGCRQVVYGFVANCTQVKPVCSALVCVNISSRDL
jgi:poly [ADP-ribose] polymerase 2/3/4